MFTKIWVREAQGPTEPTRGSAQVGAAARSGIVGARFLQVPPPRLAFQERRNRALQDAGLVTPENSSNVIPGRRHGSRQVSTHGPAEDKQHPYQPPPAKGASEGLGR